MICTPITARTTEKALREIDKANVVADLIELRIDYLKDLDENNLKKLIGRAKKKVIVTNRPKREKGFFKGSEKQRIGFLEKAIKFGAEYIDVEFSTKPALRKKLMKGKMAKRVILSYHNFKETPSLEKLVELFNKMSRTKPGIIKIITYAKSGDDNFIPIELILYAKKKRKRIISFSMGRLGKDSRILSVVFGSFLTFCSLGKGMESAEGQLTAGEMRKIYKGLKVRM